MDLSSVNATVLASLETPSTPEATPSAPTPAVDTPSVATSAQPDPPPSEAPADASSTPAPTPDSTPKHKVKVRGEELEVDYDELVKGYSRNADYTRSKQELAEFRRATEEAAQRQVAEAAQRAQQMEAFLNDPAQVLDYAKKVEAYLRSQGQLPAEGEPSVVEQVQTATRDDLMRVQRELQAAQQQTDAKIAAAEAKLKADLQRAEVEKVHAANFRQAFDAQFERHPILKTIDGIEDLVRFQVYQSDPASSDEAMDRIAQYMEAQAAKVLSFADSVHKQRALSRETLEASNIEPSGGGAPLPQPTTHKFGSPELSAAAAAWIASASKG